MTVARASGDKGFCDVLFGRIVRSRGACEGCGSTTDLQTAHILGRTFSATRCLEANAFCLCASEHARFTTHPDEWMTFVDDKIGMDEYLRLKHLALAGVVGLTSKTWWREELVRLKARCVELGLDPRRKVPSP